MKNFKDCVLLAGLAGLAVALVVAPAEAASLRLSSNGNGVTTVVNDGDANDETAGDAGIVTFVGGIANFVANSVTGITHPALGSLSAPHMNLNAVNLSAGAGTLVVAFTQTDFAGGFPFRLDFGGTTDGTVSYSAYLDPGNGAFEQSILIGSTGSISGGADHAFNTSFVSDVIPPDGPYSLTQVVEITHNSGINRTSFNATLNAVPEPGTAGLALLGLGICGAAVWRRRRTPTT
jgi:hypothetical protein